MDTCGYEKIDGYPHNGYPKDMGTGTRKIFIQQVRYGGATTRTIPTNIPIWNLIIFFLRFISFIIF